MRQVLFVCLATAWACGSAADTFVRHSALLRVGPSPSSIAAADLTGDGIPEIITTDRGRLADTRDERPAEDSVSYLLAEESMVYRALPPLRTGFGPYAVSISNVDKLGGPDLVVANFHAVRDRDLTLLRSLGDNLFEPIHFSIADDQLRYARMKDGDDRAVFPTPGLTSLLLSDLDGNGGQDAILTGWSSDVLIVIPGVEEGYFGKPVIRALSGGPRHAALGDLDGDGQLDLAVALYSANAVALLLGDGVGGFEEALRFDSRGRLPNRIARADVNGDGRKDLVVSHAHSDDSVVVFFAEKGLGYSVSQDIVLGENRHQVELGIRDMVVRDFDDDGQMDIALACREASSVVLLRNASKGDAIPQQFERETYRYGDGRPNALCVADFNGDERADLGVALWGEDAVALLLGR